MVGYYRAEMSRPSSLPFDLVIFDLDGTLVNSEELSERSLATTLSQVMPRPVAPSDMQRFRGQTIRHVLEVVPAEQGKPLPDGYLELLADEFFALCKAELRPTPGAREVVEAVADLALVCVASNGERAAVHHSLECVGMLHFFDPHIYDASLVARAKPAPDLFLYAAAQMGVDDPGRCLVVEDSLVGVEAGLAAGMSVLGFSGNHPESADALRATGVPVVLDLMALPQLVSSGALPSIA